MVRELRRWRSGVILADTTPYDTRFVAHPATGALLFAVGKDVADAQELVLWAPEESYDAMQVLLGPTEINDSDWTPELEGVRDRYLAYHGRPPSARWLLAIADAVKWRDEVHEGEEVLRPNALRSVESKLLKMINPDGHAAALCARFADATVHEAVAVGVDEWGLDVRSRVGVLRVSFVDGPVEPDDAEALLRGMIDDAAGA